LGAFGDNGNIGAKVVEMLSLARQAHFTIPDDDSHGGRERKAIIKVVADSQEEEERFLPPQADRFARAKREKKVGLLRSK
jgi:hypothetical protein